MYVSYSLFRAINSPRFISVKRLLSELSLSKTGKSLGPCSHERRTAISQAKKGKSNGRKGRIHSEETKEKMRQRALTYTHGIHALSYEEKAISARRANTILKQKLQNPAYKKLHTQKIRYGKLKKRFDKIVLSQTHFVDF